MFSTSPSRRELNKERTRKAIRNAVWTLAAQAQLVDITADQIAEEAGVSRRTFFNYYAGVGAVVAEAIRETMSDVAATFSARPETEDPLTAIINSFDAHVPLDLARWCVVLGSASSQNSEVYSQVWHRQTDWLTAVLRQRVGQSADPLFVEGLAGSVLSVFAATSKVWLDRSGGQVDGASLALFRDLLIVALTFARDGWRLSPAPPYFHS